ncbi:DUF2254 domain-containing protein [Sanguibacter antarcticus]|uniref:Putative membrane protein n=1 Tax=Sanguibacter antarcticus TaxID=372484 RepID=A0A2A9E613_9MICO|nr:DUF2254 domain-containing protein [Sanguibacter antarcticus]PFG33610.1 putative membrane protein [Sanguibacter antarcticus]
MRSRFLRARESFWFIPALSGAGAVLLALALIEVDRILQADGVRSIPLVADLSATGGRAILAAIGGTMLGVAATSFSITISVLATTSSTYGPRLVRNFMADRGNQVVLAVHTSTFLYSLVVLRAVRTEQDSTVAFVPSVAVSVAVLLATCGVAVLVYFIHHIASSVQVTTLQSRVLAELLDVVDLVYPDEPARETTKDSVPDVTTTDETFRATSPGYVQHVDLRKLVSAARSADVVVRVLATPGAYVLAGQPIAESIVDARHEHAHPSAPRGGSTTSLASAVASAFTVATPRTPHQDLRYAAQGLVEIGIRGLAAGTNDPYTCVSAIDALSVALTTLCSRPARPDEHADDEHRLRVLCTWPTPAEVLADVFLALRTYSMDHPLVVRAGVELIDRLEPVTTGETRRALRLETEAFHDAYLATQPPAFDAGPVLTALGAVRLRLSDHPVPRSP